MKPIQRFLWCASWVVASVAPAAAHAQVFTNINRLGSTRLMEPGGISTTLTATNPIGRRDCASHERWSMTVTFAANPAGMNTTSLDYYVGADMTACATSTQRSMSTTTTPSVTTPRCWRINQLPSLTRSNPPVGLSYTVEIESRYLVNPVTGDCLDTSATTQGTAGTNYLSLVASPPMDMNVVGTIAIPFDVAPPDPPTSVTASPGEGAINVGWTYTSTTTTTTTDTDASTTTTSGVPTDLQGFWLLCDPPLREAPSDAGADAGDVGVDAALDVADDDPDPVDPGTPGDTSCSATTVLGTAMFDPNDDEQFERYRCSNSILSSTSTSGTAQGLVNGRAYHVAVVAQDLAGNRSTVAVASTCVRPAPVTDFWEWYRTQGGAAQPGLCDARPGRGGATGAYGWIMLAVTGAAWRRRRRIR